MNKGIGIRTADIYLRFPEIMEEEADDLAEFLEDEKILYEGATDVFIDLQKKAELGEHYKHLYSEVKKRNDNAIEYIKNKREQLHHSFDEPSWDYLFICNPDDLLRMLGEKDG